MTTEKLVSNEGGSRNVFEVNFAYTSGPGKPPN